MQNCSSVLDDLFLVVLVDQLLSSQVAQLNSKRYKVITSIKVKPMFKTTCVQVFLVVFAGSKSPILLILIELQVVFNIGKQKNSLTKFHTTSLNAWTIVPKSRPSRIHLRMSLGMLYCPSFTGRNNFRFLAKINQLMNQSINQSKQHPLNELNSGPFLESDETFRAHFRVT